MFYQNFGLPKPARAPGILPPLPPPPPSRRPCAHKLKLRFKIVLTKELLHTWCIINSFCTTVIADFACLSGKVITDLINFHLMLNLIQQLLIMTEE